MLACAESNFSNLKFENLRKNEFLSEAGLAGLFWAQMGWIKGECVMNFWPPFFFMIRTWALDKQVKIIFEFGFDLAEIFDHKVQNIRLRSVMHTTESNFWFCKYVRFPCFSYL